MSRALTALPIEIETTKKTPREEKHIPTIGCTHAFWFTSESADLVSFLFDQFSVVALRKYSKHAKKSAQ